MRHHNSKRKFGRTRNVRNALMKSLAYALIKEEKIQTTEAKAKELRPMIEKFVTRAKTDTVANRRLIASRIGSAKEISKLFTDIAPRYKDRKGGYTRITKLPRRKSDASPIAIIEFV